MQDRLPITAAIVLFTFTSAASAATCDRVCLLDQAKQFNANMLAHTTEKIPLVPGARIFENTKAIALMGSRWSTIKQIRSQGVYTDAAKGNVIEHVAAENADGKIVYIGTRLKIADGRISEVEINFDDRANVN